MPEAPTLLFRVAAAWPLPGLGLLALAETAASQLVAYPLHTALAVEVVLPDGQRLYGPATVEEISRGEALERGLLLDLGPAATLPAGTEIWLVPSVE